MPIQPFATIPSCPAEARAEAALRDGLLSEAGQFALEAARCHREIAATCEGDRGLATDHEAAANICAAWADGVARMRPPQRLGGRTRQAGRRR